MITIVQHLDEKGKNTQRNWKIMNGEDEILNLNLIFGPVSNKYGIIADYIGECSSMLGDEFNNWFVDYIKEYSDPHKSYDTIINNIDKIKMYVKKHLELTGVDFSEYVNKSKISKNSIFFEAEEIEKIILCSNYLKFYYMVDRDPQYKLPDSFFKQIYNILTEDLNSDRSIIYKLYKIVSSKIYRYNLANPYMLQYISDMFCKTNDIHITSIFNFIVNHILVTCKTRDNPIPYMTSVVDESMNWLLKSVYKDIIIYSDTVSTEDINLSGKDNLKTYAYNNTIAKLVIGATDAFKNTGIDDMQFTDAMKINNELSIMARFVTYPIISEIMGIPYSHLKTISVDYSYILNILLYDSLPMEFKEKYPVICRLLLCINKDKMTDKADYRLKNIDGLFKTRGKFLGFNNITYASNMYSSVIAKVVKNKYIDIKSQMPICDISPSIIEDNFVQFYNDFFDKRFNDMYEKMRLNFNYIIS